MAFFKQTQSPPLSVPTSYVQDRAEQIIQPTHSEVEEEDLGRERDENEVEEVDEVSPIHEQVGAQNTSVDDPLEPHRQKWEVLDLGISICQRAGAGLHFDYTWFR